MESKQVFLRTVETADAPLLLLWENDPEVMRVSNRSKKYTLQEITTFISTAQNVEENKQLRLMVCEFETERPIGTVDLYDINFSDKNAGIGVLIKDKNDRKKGFALAAIKNCIAIGVKKYQILNYFCVVQASNHASLRLFEKLDFERVGVRKNWYQNNGEWEDEIMFQRHFIQ